MQFGISHPSLMVDVANVAPWEPWDAFESLDQTLEWVWPWSSSVLSY